MRRSRYTKEGYEKLKAEYDALKAERPDAVKELSKARDMGDLSENGYYKASKQKLTSIDSRLMRLSYEIKTARIIDADESTGVGIGSTVTLENSDRTLTFQFVGDFEADPSEKKLSLLSPFGKAVEGKVQGDEIEVATPSGKVKYKIVKVI